MLQLTVIPAGHLSLPLHRNSHISSLRFLLSFKYLNCTQMHTEWLYSLKNSNYEDCLLQCHAVRVYVCDSHSTTYTSYRSSEERAGLEPFRNLCSSFLIATTIVEPHGGASLPQQVTVLTFLALLQISGKVLVYWNQPFQAPLTFACWFLWRLELPKFLVIDLMLSRGSLTHSAVCWGANWSSNEPL